MEKASLDGRIPVFINPAAGGGGADDPLAVALRDAGVDAEIRPTHPAELAGAIARAVSEGARVVGVSGGDGTLLTAANVLAGSCATLAPFPSGTLNHIARRLGLEDLPTAARAVAAGRSEGAPAGVMDDRLFLNTATFGLYADVVRRRERMRPWIRKWPAAAVGFFQTVLNLRSLSISLLVEGEVVTCDTPLVWVGVGWGSFPFVHESPDERALPELEIVILRPGGRVGAIFLLLRILLLLRDREKLRDDPGLQFINARHMVIHAEKRVGVTLDGEVLRCDGPIYVGILEGALSVRTPAPRPDTAG
jgi:diacylglycerol kinase family enzyme